jgi:hypothetical protein
LKCIYRFRNWLWQNVVLADRLELEEEYRPGEEWGKEERVAEEPRPPKKQAAKAQNKAVDEEDEAACAY